MMHNENRTRIARLSVWFCLNLVIFIACYLNYRLQLKHRYLYKTLNVGLCFSRAAAMVINFNLLLVWLPMCKYTLTRVACLATGALKRQKQLHQLSIKANAAIPTISCTIDNNYTSRFKAFQEPTSNVSNQSGVMSKYPSNNKAIRFTTKLKASIGAAVRQFRQWFLIIKMNFINSFLTAVDHCVSLHTICATTITVASIIHTAAHILNVINFSKNFDPFLSNLNMALYKGQNPLQLLISVPGLTGSLMIVILLLMSLSSTDVIRNSSYDLFQIFHRLSIIFVILLFLHPSSHVLKEQSNVERHHPELCYASMTILSNNSLTKAKASTSTESFAHNRLDSELVAPPGQLLPLQHNGSNSYASFTSNNTNIHSQGQSYSVDTKSTPGGLQVDSNRSNDGSEKILTDLNNIVSTGSNKQIHMIEPLTANRSEHNLTVYDLNYYNSRNTSLTELMKSARTTQSSCLDLQPSFVAQSSICWYVLTFGLSCYLLDLLLRKLRRSKSRIELLDARSDEEGNLIELILSNNHKRFNQWLPGQFIYLNCPQIAVYEWHPFTISSMDNRSGQFTLHIKTGGDWTKKLRNKLESNYMQNSVSTTTLNGSIPSLQQENSQASAWARGENLRANILRSAKLHLDLPALPEFECYDKTGHQQIECKKVSQICTDCETCLTGAETDYVRVEFDHRYSQLKEGQCEFYSNLHDYTIKGDLGLDLFIDGPFHSPFERLLEQQVSVCIASGIGWTAFSSLFQSLTNPHASWSDKTKDCWWNEWKNFAISDQSVETVENTNNCSNSSPVYKNCNNLIRGDYHQCSGSNNHKFSSKTRKLSNTKLHLMVIVTSIEQLKPFYKLAISYFNQVQDEYKTKFVDQLNPVRMITAFITRSSSEDETVKEFCRRENISITSEEKAIQVNSVFAIQFGKPDFNLYLSSFDREYSGKISVYCCGSYQIKKTVRDTCYSLNRKTKSGEKLFYSYHEESF